MIIFRPHRSSLDETMKEAKEFDDVEKMKENFNLTLDLAKVIGKSTIESIKEWYEIFKSTN